MRRLGILAVLVAIGFAFGAGLGVFDRALGHEPVLNTPDGKVRTWTHGNHAGDAIGVAACVSNQHEITKCITHGGKTFKFRAPFPQVPVNPVYAGATSVLTTKPEGYEWWWTVSNAGPGGTPAVCVYDWRTYLPPVRGRVDFRQVACLGPDERDFSNPHDVGTGDLTPPADFVRAQTAPR